MVKQRKYSKQRDAILKILLGTKTHPSARWIYGKLKPEMPDLSLGTVYRNLGVLQDEGAAVSVGVVAGEERFDGFIKPHPHLVCQTCGAIQDRPISRGRRMQRVGGESWNFVIDHRKTVFLGICDKCAERLSEQTA
ncbi:MAG: transcriptional repressor [Spirochaetaceae bacterium]|jgi:Fur family peroxide stress response transcriptional regulator|nr:transcriptional repressor [Spirochaetaceae bacterium]